jgi:hypothetical protein
MAIRLTKRTLRRWHTAGFSLLAGGSILLHASLAEAQSSSIKTVSIALHPYKSSGTNAQKTTATSLTVQLPMYAGGVKDPNGPAIRVFTSGSPYLKAGSATFLVHATVRTLKAWYARNMVKYGFSSTGDGVLSDGLLFSSKKITGLTVELDFKRSVQKPEDTTVEYWVTDLAPPHRAKTSFIPGDVTRVEVTYQPVSEHTSLQKITREFDQKDILRALVQDINGLPVEIRSNTNENSTLLGGAVLQFVTAKGQRIDVTLDFQKNELQVQNSPMLFDVQNVVWTTVSNDMGYSLYLPSK